MLIAVVVVAFCCCCGFVPAPVVVVVVVFSCGGGVVDHAHSSLGRLLIAVSSVIGELFAKLQTGLSAQK